MAKIQLVNPVQDQITKLYQKTLNIEQSVAKIGEQYLKLGDFVNRSNLTNVVLAYLFAQGVTKFQFVRVLVLTPKHNVTFLKTDKGYAIVEINTENEYTEVNGNFVDYSIFRDVLHDYLVLLEEVASPFAVKDIREEIARWSE